jgi:hypothetical protein
MQRARRQRRQTAAAAVVEFETLGGKAAALCDPVAVVVIAVRCLDWSRTCVRGGGGGGGGGWSAGRARGVQGLKWFDSR